jgi:hypothetical protein
MLACDFRNLVGKIVLAQHYPRGSEGVGFDDIAADREKTSVDLLNDVRTAQDQKFVAALPYPRNHPDRDCGTGC